MMPFFNYFILSNFFSILVLICLLVFIACDKTFSRRINLYFLMAVITDIILIAVDGTRLYYGLMSEHHFIETVAAAVGYVIRPFTIGMILLITVEGKKSFRIFTASILGINGLVQFLNLFCPASFYIDEANKFHRSFLWFFPYLVCVIILIVLIVAASTRLHSNRRKLIFTCFIVAALIVAACFEAFDLAWFEIPAVVSVILLFFYFNLNVDMYKRDALTKLYNRRNFDMDLDKYSSGKMVIASMDLNDLKYYNDTAGHAAGDRAILTSVKGMNECFGKIGILYRTGGDEFMAIFPKKTEAEVQDCIKKFQEYMSKTEYRVACGCAQFNHGDILEEVISLSDQRMYNNKAQIKSAKS